MSPSVAWLAHCCALCGCSRPTAACSNGTNSQLCVRPAAWLAGGGPRAYQVWLLVGGSGDGRSCVLRRQSNAGRRARQNLWWRPAGADPTAASFPQVECEESWPVGRAHWLVGNVLQEGAGAIYRGVATQASPLRGPRVFLPAVNWCPMHVAVRQLPPRFWRFGPRRIRQVDARATQGQYMLRWAWGKCFAVAGRGGVVLRRWAGQCHPMCTAGIQERLCCLWRPVGSAGWAAQRMHIGGEVSQATKV